MTSMFRTEKQHLIEVYLFATKRKIRKNRWNFASQHIEIDFEKPLFFDKQQACVYSQFLTDNYCLIKAYVLDAAVESKNNNLHLRSNYLCEGMIQGISQA